MLQRGERISLLYEVGDSAGASPIGQRKDNQGWLKL